MEKRGVLLILALVLLVSAFQVSAVDSIDNVKPQVTAVFGENVILIPPFAIKNSDTEEVFMLDNVFQKDNRTFTFVPQKSLSNGKYEFMLYASDLVGNMKSYLYEFEVFVPGTRILLVQPNSIGVANQSTFTVQVYTSYPSVCKYTGVKIASFDDIKLKFFDATGNLSLQQDSWDVNDHFINSYSVEPDFPKKFFVSCKDYLGRENFADFTLYSDLIPPTLKSVFFNPSPVVEYPPEGDLYSVLNVVATEPVICKYSNDSNASYDEMTPFSGYDKDDFDAYKETNTETIFFPSDVTKQSFTYYVQCEDRARHLSYKVTEAITVDLGTGLLIRVVSPPAFSKNTTVFLNFTTNRRAYCVFKSAQSGFPVSYTDPAAALSSSYENLATVHYKPLGTKSSGSYTITMRCDVPEGVGLTALSGETSYTFVIDTIPPSVPKVNATTPVCTSTLSASFVANDTQSGISEYRWSVGSAGAVMANGTVKEGKVSVSKNNNGSAFVLSDLQSYVFSVIAVDGAGNVGTAGASNEIKYDSTGITCDKVPPVVTVLKSATGDSASILCTDNQSGCSALGSYYGSSYSQPCNATQYFLEPVVVPLFRSTIICWNIKDNAGNVNQGSQIVDLNTTALNMTPGISASCVGGIDGDGDGYGERCLMGPDCDDTNPNISVGCANGCVQDLDGDGYGTGCLKGNDCNGRDAALTTSCPNNCISDNDGDSFGLMCDNGPDCKGDDSTLTTNCPNGCVDDNDGDGYGLSCPAGFDCNGENALEMISCEDQCVQDTDADKYGVACLLGLDCNGRNPSSQSACDNACNFDEDGDGYGFGCTLGLDCNGMHPLVFMDCANACTSDNDGDSYGKGCAAGPDCNDTDPRITRDCTYTSKCIEDSDGDGYGLGCAVGADCNDYDLSISDSSCTTNCTDDDDCNRLPNDWQMQYFNNTVCNDTNWCGIDADPDGDGFTNIEEYRQGTNPLVKEEVNLPQERPSEEFDKDGDGMPDACEKMYGLSPDDPFDADKDPDKDTLNNKFECTYKVGACVNWLNPNNPDTDNDGYTDNVEIDAGTDPCDPNSYPSSWIPLIVVLLGVLSIIGSTAYLIYKNYYIPLVSPPQKTSMAAVTGAVAGARPSGAPLPGVPQGPRHIAPRRPQGPIMSRKRFEDEMSKRAEERDKLLGVFGARKAIPKSTRIMEEIARRPAETRKVAIIKPEEKATPAQLSKISKVVGDDYFDKISKLTKGEADYFGKLAYITKQKDVSLEEDQVSRLASISKKVGEDSGKQKELEAAFKKSPMDELDSFLSTKKPIESFIKEYVPKEKESKSAFDELSAIAGKGDGKSSFGALEELSAPKKKEVLDALSEISSKSAREIAMSKMDKLSGLESKDEVFKAFRQMSKEKHVDKNVFEVLLSYLLKSGKISKKDVYDLLLGLEEQGVLSKEDVSEVFFNLGIKGVR